MRIGIDYNQTTKIIEKVSIVFMNNEKDFRIDESKVIGKVYTNDDALKTMVNSAKIIPTLDHKEIIN